MKWQHLLKPIAALAIVAGLGATGYFTRAHWLLLVKPTDAVPPSDTGEVAAAPSGKIIVNEQAQVNLGLKAKSLQLQTYWKTILIPGMIVDRAGISDRDVVAPATGVISRVFHLPGDAVRPGDKLFTLKLLSESLHLAQSELLKATQDIELLQVQRKRLAAAVPAVPESRVIEIDQQATRLQTSVKAYRQELQNRGFSTKQIDGIAAGEFINEVDLVVPLRTSDPKTTTLMTVPSGISEVQELKVAIGQQVQAGQALCVLANHQWLAIEGRAFRDETLLLEKSINEKWPIEVDFQEDAASGWGELAQTFRIRHLANTIDPLNRTFAFLMPLENQARIVTDGDHQQTLWRFRPGQKVRLRIRVEKLDNVFVLPADAVTFDGPEAFIFTQNSNTFERQPVRVLQRNQQQVVIANAEPLLPHLFAVQSGAAQLNRMVKAGGSSGVPKGYHIHADGSLHKNEDEGK